MAGTCDNGNSIRDGSLCCFIRAVASCYRGLLHLLYFLVEGLLVFWSYQGLFYFYTWKKEAGSFYRTVLENRFIVKQKSIWNLKCLLLIYNVFKYVWKINLVSYILFLIILYMCGPRISAHAFPTRWQARF